MLHLNPLILVDILGIIAFAVSGFLVGTRNNLDILGVVIAASLTALGGGIVRDTILSVTPFAFKTLYPATALFVVIFLAFVIKIHRFGSIEKRWLFVISDTIGLVAFSITGALLAIGAGYNFFGVIILSFITAMGGGVIRDILINQVPAVLISDFYGSISVIVSILLLLLHVSDLLNQTTILFVAIFSIALRLVAYKYKWELPKII
ncbi:TRIC cation channel family protein [Sulfurimonas sp. HSL-1716]|uniref:trimeric intracellular cation channel family protein n=1 Tax=Hydrocurvibacter sulfurireducens TaxID=3131937 RepID=UPI0031F900E9